MDNIFIERLWRSIKYEEVHLKAHADAREARAGISSWSRFGKRFFAKKTRLSNDVRPAPND